MNYLLDRKSVFSSYKTRRPRGGGGFGFVIIIVFLLILFLIALFSGFISDATSLFRGSGQAAAGSVFGNIGYFRDRASLVEENKNLKNELRQASLTAVSLQNKADELVRLEAAVGRVEVAAEKRLIAKVLTFSGYRGYDVLLIDRGARSQINGRPIALGDLAVLGEDIILGEVVKLGVTTSAIRLYSSAGRKTAVRIGTGALPGLAEGLGGGNYLVTLPANISVGHGDVVRTTKGENDFILGIVGAVSKDEGVPFQKIYIKPPVNIYELSYLNLVHR